MAGVGEVKMTNLAVYHLDNGVKQQMLLPPSCPDSFF